MLAQFEHQLESVVKVISSITEHEHWLLVGVVMMLVAQQHAHLLQWRRIAVGGSWQPCIQLLASSMITRARRVCAPAAVSVQWRPFDGTSILVDAMLPSVPAVAAGCLSGVTLR